MKSSQTDWLDEEWAAYERASGATGPRGITEHEIRTLLLFGVIPPATPEWDERLLLPRGITETELKALIERTQPPTRLAA